MVRKNKLTKFWQCLFLKIKQFQFLVVIRKVIREWILVYKVLIIGCYLKISLTYFFNPTTTYVVKVKHPNFQLRTETNIKSNSGIHTIYYINCTTTLNIAKYLKEKFLLSFYLYYVVILHLYRNNCILFFWGRLKDR